MTKKTNDVIIRDRMQVTLTSGGDATTQYARISLDDWVSVSGKKGFAVDEVYFQLRDPSSELFTGTFNPCLLALTTAAAADATLKLTLGNIAYETLVDVGLASPGIVALEEWTTSYYDDAANVGGVINTYNQWSPESLQPSGFVTVSDLLVGFACNDVTAHASSTIEIDVLLIGHSVTLNAGQLTQMLQEGLDN
jgi:hypothetical protein